MLDPEPPPFTFAFAPTLAGSRFSSEEHVEPFRLYLEATLARPVRLVIPASYDAALDALRAGRADAAMVGEVVSRQGETGGVEPLVEPIGDDQQVSTYRSVFIARRDTGIQNLAMVRGRSLGLVDGQSTSGYLVPRAMLREAGIDPEADLTIRLYGSHLDVIEAVLAGEVVAGAVHEGRLTRPTPARGPEFARLRVLARSRPIPKGPLVVRSSLDAETRARLAEAMLRIHEAAPDAAALMLRQGHRFTTATTRAAPTLKSIAALAGVSYATVSRVVNGAANVAPETAARVQAIIDELGYAPNGNARVLLGRQRPLVGLVATMASLSDASSASGIEEIRRALEREGIPLVICPIGASPGASPFPDLLRDKRLGALIVGTAHAHDPEIVRLARTGHTVLALGVEHDEQVPVGVMRARLDTVASDVLTALGEG